MKTSDDATKTIHTLSTMTTSTNPKSIVSPWTLGDPASPLPQHLILRVPTPGAVGFPIRFGGVSYTIRILMYRDVS